MNCYIDRVYRYDSGLLIGIRKESEKLHLITTRHRTGLTRYVSEEGRKRDPVLKNLIEHVRIVDIHNPRIDRIVCIHLCNGTRLVFEAYRADEHCISRSGREDQMVSPPIRRQRRESATGAEVHAVSETVSRCVRLQSRGLSITGKWSEVPEDRGN